MQLHFSGVCPRPGRIWLQYDARAHVCAGILTLCGMRICGIDLQVRNRTSTRYAYQLIRYSITKTWSLLVYIASRASFWAGLAACNASVCMGKRQLKKIFPIRAVAYLNFRGSLDNDSACIVERRREEERGESITREFYNLYLTLWGDRAQFKPKTWYLLSALFSPLSQKYR